MDDADLTKALEDLFAPIEVSELDRLRCAEYLRRARWEGIATLSSADAIRHHLSISRAPAHKLAAALALQRLSTAHAMPQVLTLDHVASKVRTSPFEQLYGLYWTDEQQLLHSELLVSGTVSSLDVLPYAALRPAFLLGARVYSLLHNHPSGQTNPSAFDLATGDRLKRISREVGIELASLHIVTSSTLLHVPL